MDGGQKKRLAALVSQPVKWACPLDRYTSFAIGGPAEAIATVDSHHELQSLLSFLVSERIPWRVIGRGTNLLVGDAGFAGVIILLGRDFEEFAEMPAENGTVAVTAGGACGLARLALHCAAQGFTGLEFACGIPGTVGGAVIMNAGAWGKDMATVLRSVTVVTPDREERILRQDLNFSYRSWPGFAHYRGLAVVARVELALGRGDAAAIQAHCKMLQDRRKAAQPPGKSAGSFFKNPPDDSAGRLIEVSGLKGTKIGGAMVSERHGNFLVNTGNATAGDVLRLMQFVQEKVAQDCGIMLEPEVHFI